MSEEQGPGLLGAQVSGPSGRKGKLSRKVFGVERGAYAEFGFQRMTVKSMGGRMAMESGERLERS